MEIIQSTIAFIIVIGILVFVHELGHFLTAKWSGMRADVFALGMGPRLLGWNRRTGFTFGRLPADLDLEDDTDYRICALPIGGYVKIVGMVDESLDTDFAGKPPMPYEFRSKKNWQKAIVLSAGVIMNFLLAIAVFWIQPLVSGREEMATTRVAWVDPKSDLFRAGLSDGDEVMAIDGAEVTSFDNVVLSLSTPSGNQRRKITVNRGGNPTIVTIDEAALLRSVASGNGIGLYPDNVRVRFSSVDTMAPAGVAGLKAGDAVLAMDSVPVRSVVQLQQYVQSHAGRNVRLHIERSGATLPIDCVVGRDRTIGVQLESAYEGEKRIREYGVFEALGMAVTETGATIGMIGSSVMHVLQGTVSVKQSFGGPIKIAQMAGRSSEIGIDAFLRFMALISISLGVMNLLPLPGLDGGHLVFVAIETVIRREIPTTVKIRFQQVGIALLLMLMAFVFWVDLTP